MARCDEIASTGRAANNPLAGKQLIIHHRLMDFRELTPSAIAATAAPIAGTLWWMAIDDISFAWMIASPIPYALSFVSLIIALPVYLALSDWIASRLWPLLLLATMGASPFVIKAMVYFLTPRNMFASFIILSVSWITAIVFWAVLALFRRSESSV